MISEKAFEKFLDKEFDEFPDCGYELLYMAWQACEEYYESRREEWKPIPGYYGKYEISDKGNIRNPITKRILSQWKDTKGYLMVTLNKRNKCKRFRVHRLLAKLFIPNPDNKREVNHKDLNKSNNSLDNLEWCTPKENTKHAYDNGAIKIPDQKGENNSAAKLNYELVRQIRVL